MANKRGSSSTVTNVNADGTTITFADQTASAGVIAARQIARGGLRSHQRAGGVDAAEAQAAILRFDSAEDHDLAETPALLPPSNNISGGSGDSSSGGDVWSPVGRSPSDEFLTAGSAGSQSQSALLRTCPGQSHTIYHYVTMSTICATFCFGLYVGAVL